MNELENRRRNSWHSSCSFKLFALIYALVCGGFCLWLASFMPAEGPSLTARLPSQSGAVLHVRDGARFLALLNESSVLQEFSADPDANELFQIAARSKQPLAQYRQLPAVARRLFPAKFSSLYPFLGREWALDLAPGRVGERKDEILFLTRLSGGRGLLVRLALAFLKLPQNLKFFDLGGGLIALGANGAEPAAASPLSSTAPAQPAAGELLPLLEITLRPEKTESAGANSIAVAETTQFKLLAKTLPQSVLAALLKPPAAAEIFNVGAPPEELHLNVFAAGDGTIKASGWLRGQIPPLGQPGNSAQPSAPAAGEAFAEARLPVNLRAAFLYNLQKSMTIRAQGKSLSRAQRRCVELFSRLRLNALDLDRDFWPAFGNVLQTEVKEAPADSAWRQGVIQASGPFAGNNEKAHAAAAILGDMYFNFRLDDPPENKLQRYEEKDADGYVLGLASAVPAWVFTPEHFAFTWDAGVLARQQPERTIAKLLREAPHATQGGERADSYYLRLDGERLAGTVETLTAWWFNDLEDELGAKDFMDRYPDAPARIRLAHKLSLLLGHFFLEAKPVSAKEAEVRLEWRPGTLKAAEGDN